MIKDASYSEDNDTIVTRIWKVYYDENNNGCFEEEEGIIVSSENDKELRYKTKEVGKYKVELEVIESFDNTIEEYICEADYRRTNTKGRKCKSKL